VAGLVVGAIVWLWRGLAPMPAGQALYVRFWRPLPFATVLVRLQEYGIVRSHTAVRLYALFDRAPSSVAVGTYLLTPGDSPSTIIKELRSPIKQMVRMPETNWARRDARLLERYQVTSADEYLKDVGAPGQFKSLVDFPLPAGSLEGYLYPDTYDFPPLFGAENVVKRRLAAFESKVWDAVGKPKELSRIVTVASLVELEAGTDADRPRIAAVIYNRLAKGMPLEIDASIEYGLGKWRRLYFKDYTGVKSPYNLYLHKGLPPTPICSPSLKSIQAAMHPTKDKFLYYVALPGGESLFATTYQEHLKNVQIRRSLLDTLDFFR
jgi:UPF0755 protein